MSMQKRIEFGEFRHNKTSKMHLLDALENNWISAGPKVKLFEDEWGNLFGYEHNIAMSSGTDAVLNACLVLYELGAVSGDEVIVPALGFIATANAVRAAGFTPVFVDIKRETLNIDEKLVETNITNKTKAIIAVHTMGRMCEMNELSRLAKKYNLILIEDACEAHGAKYYGSYPGALSDMVCFSFFPAHLLVTGEGGMVSTNNEHIAKILRSTMCHGQPDKKYFNHTMFGLNSKMTDIAASIGLGEVKYFWETFNTRHETVKQFREALRPYDNIVLFSEEELGCINCPHAFSLTLKHQSVFYSLRCLLTKILDKANIHWKRNFGCIPTQHKAFEYLRNSIPIFFHEIGDFPEAEHVGNYGIHIGVHQYLTQDDKNHIITTLSGALEEIQNV